MARHGLQLKLPLPLPRDASLTLVRQASLRQTPERLAQTLDALAGYLKIAHGAG